jgi:hypothetical protein
MDADNWHLLMQGLNLHCLAACKVADAAAGGLGRYALDWCALLQAFCASACRHGRVDCALPCLSGASFMCMSDGCLPTVHLFLCVCSQGWVQALLAAHLEAVQVADAADNAWLLQHGTSSVPEGDVLDEAAGDSSAAVNLRTTRRNLAAALSSAAARCPQLLGGPLLGLMHRVLRDLAMVRGAGWRWVVMIDACLFACLRAHACIVVAHDDDTPFVTALPTPLLCCMPAGNLGGPPVQG